MNDVRATSMRLTRLLQELKRVHQSDWYIKDLDEDLRRIPEFKSQVGTYDRVLQSLDPCSWERLKCKARETFKQNREGRGKSAFFDQLNEAFAYRYLVNQHGHSLVRFLPENKQKGVKCPDIYYKYRCEDRYCEVKTIGMSDEMIGRFENPEVLRCYGVWYSEMGNSYDKDSMLPAIFLKKLTSTIEGAFKQVRCNGNQNEMHGMVYVVVNLDDSTLQHYVTYRKQIVGQLLSGFPNDEIYVKFGIGGQKHIHHNPVGEVGNA